MKGGKRLSTDNPKSKTPPRIIVLATEQEKEDAAKLAGGEREVSNYIRRLILRDAKERAFSLQEGSFNERPGGNATSGEERRGGKENGRPVLNSTPVVG